MTSDSGRTQDDDMTTTYHPGSPYVAPVAPAGTLPTPVTPNPDCSLCDGTGTDPDFGGTCVECVKASRPGYRPTPASDLAPLAEWLAGQTWSEFATDLARYYRKHGTLSPKQEAAARSMKAKCDARDAVRAEAKAKAEAQDAAVDAGAPALDLTVLVPLLGKVPGSPVGKRAGRFAVPGGDTRLKVLIEAPTKGKWAGTIFVKDAAEYGTGTRYGQQRPGSTYRGDITEALTAILADPKAAFAAYGRLVGTCGVCGRHLEDEASVAAGIGPVCAAKF